MADIWDRIDRQHKARPPLQLECEDCAKADAGVFRRHSTRVGDDETRVLCAACWERWR